MLKCSTKQGAIRQHFYVVADAWMPALCVRCAILGRRPSETDVGCIVAACMTTLQQRSVSMAETLSGGVIRVSFQNVM